MNGSPVARLLSWIKRWKRQMFWILLILPWLPLVFCRSAMSPLFSCLIGFVAVLCTLMAFACLFTLSARPRNGQLVMVAPVRSPALETASRPLPLVQQRQTFPSIPRTAKDVHRTLDPTEFEFLSAAVVIGLGEGHTFYRHCGGKGDQGVDVILLNKHGLKVAVQAKRYVSHRSVASKELREFGEAMRFHNCIYGYFVATSTFTPGAKQVISANGFIRPIDGRALDYYLQDNHQAIAQAYYDIQNQVPK